MDTNYPHPLLLPTTQYSPVYQKVVKPMMYIFLPVLVVLRALIVLPLLLVSSFIDFLCNLGTDQSQPLGPVRTKIYEINKKITYRLALLGLGFITISHGRPNQSAQVIISNHCSMLDILAFSSSGISSAIAKQGLANNIFFSPTVRLTRSVLARKGGASQLIRQRFQEKKWPPLGCFAQGTTTVQYYLTKFRTGIFLDQPDSQIVTIKYHCLRNPFYVINAKSHLSNVLSGLFGIIEIRFSDQVYHSKNQTVNEYIEMLETKMQHQLGAVQTGYYYQDIMWYVGNNKDYDTVSEKYKREQAWRGTRDQWTKKCKQLGKNPEYGWSKKEMGIAG